MKKTSCQMMKTTFIKFWWLENLGLVSILFVHNFLALILLMVSLVIDTTCSILHCFCSLHSCLDTPLDHIGDQNKFDV